MFKRLIIGEKAKGIKGIQYLRIRGNLVVAIRTKRTVVLNN